MSVTSQGEGSITQCIERLKRGDRAAAERLWDAYIRRLVGLARAKMRAAPQRVADEEDVALSAFDSFYRRAERGQFARLDDRDDLWQLLVVITERKALGLMRHERRKSRGEGRVVSLSEVANGGIDGALDPEPSPDFAAQFAEECRRLLDLLGDDTLRSVAVWKMEGHTNAEIAGLLGCVEQTVERKLRSIRRLWDGEQPA
jgi:DNA-directed RNA polymerase specialized sigma24 family protein